MSTKKVSAHDRLFKCDGCTYRDWQPQVVKSQHHHCPADNHLPASKRRVRVLYPLDVDA